MKPNENLPMVIDGLALANGFAPLLTNIQKLIASKGTIVEISKNRQIDYATRRAIDEWFRVLEEENNILIAKLKAQGEKEIQVLHAKAIVDIFTTIIQGIKEIIEKGYEVLTDIVGIHRRGLERLEKEITEIKDSKILSEPQKEQLILEVRENFPNLLVYKNFKNWLDELSSQIPTLEAKYLEHLPSASTKRIR